ncbi:N-acetylglucosaminyl-diphospho-decaprenol L-rhamnosyltransferase [Thermoflexales bacterium]|nr:N-acetylglucosaminyl-diphospho-decaprenol L-rhamnosyltransferase [Thermoflexales bacterium]
MTTALVVLNWRNAAGTVACLDSLKNITTPDVAVIVVDNGSGDDSVSVIRQRHPDLTLLETGANLGYAGGNNVGIRYALEHGAAAVGVLNNDALADPAFLQPLLATSQHASHNAILTSMICETEEPEIIWALGGRINWKTAASQLLHAGEQRAAWKDCAPHTVDFAIGTALLAPRQVWEKAGLIDESFFLYYEETDWCVRAQRLGIPSVAVPASCVWHEAGAGGGRTSPQVTYYMTRNALRFLRRNLAGRRRILPLFRVALRAHWHVLGDVRRGQTTRARARMGGVYDFVRGKAGPRVGRPYEQ